MDKEQQSLPGTRPMKVTVPTKADCNLSESLDSINAVKSHMRALQQRFRVIESAPCGRAQLLPQERVEYDSIGALFCDLRNSLAREAL